jgi:hypothetical protein
MIHRDVKCQNSLLHGFHSGQLDGQSLAKVADFGTVRADDPEKHGRVAGI